jgi:uncharacterized membrane protein
MLCTAAMTKSKLIARASLAWQRAHTSLWFVPAVMVVCAIVLSTVLINIDAHLEKSYAGSWWLFGGSATGGRTILSVIAGSLITVAAVAFSVTMLAIQQASTQFTPRILRNFTRDRGNQIVLGSYIATFTYALLVLRKIRSNEDGEMFVPPLAISTGLFLAVVSLGLLIYFIHHVSQSLQVGVLLSNVRDDLDHELERMFPEPLEPGFPDDDAASARARFDRQCEGTVVAISSEQEGYVRLITVNDLVEAAHEGEIKSVHVMVRIGEFVRVGDVLMRVWVPSASDQHGVERLRDAIQLDRDRSIEQDLSFGIRQIVDIAVKALSPGINDPTTAEQALDHLGGTLAVLLERTIPSPLRKLDHDVECLFTTASFGELVDECFGQIQACARTNLHVTRYIAKILRNLVSRASASPAREAVLRDQLDDLLACFDRSGYSPRELRTLDQQRLRPAFYLQTSDDAISAPRA